LVLFFAIASVAANQPARAADPAIAAAETSVRLGLTAGYGDYEENLVPRDTEAGAVIGVSAGVSSLMPYALPGFDFPDLYADAGYDFSAGLMKDRGDPLNRAATPYQARDDAYYNTAVVRLGAGAPVGGGQEVIPYVAGGYQNWYRNVGGPAGFGEFYRAEMIGGGLKVDFAGSPSLVVQAAAEAFAVIGGGVTVPAERYDGSFGPSAEERISLDADYRLTPTWHAFAGLGFVHYEYSGSKPDDSGRFEPLSTTLQVNSMFGIAYGF
jgi:hypothetical protein